MLSISQVESSFFDYHFALLKNNAKKRNRNSWHCLCVGHVPVKPPLIGKKGPKASQGGPKMGVVKQPK